MTAPLSDLKTKLYCTRSIPDNFSEESLPLYFFEKRRIVYESALEATKEYQVMDYESLCREYQSMNQFPEEFDKIVNLITTCFRECLGHRYRTLTKSLYLFKTEICPSFRHRKLCLNYRCPFAHSFAVREAFRGLFESFFSFQFSIEEMEQLGRPVEPESRCDKKQAKRRFPKSVSSLEKFSRETLSPYQVGFEEEKKKALENPKSFDRDLERIQKAFKRFCRRQQGPVQDRYKHQLCQTRLKGQVCPYDHKCQFAHSIRVLFAMLRLENSKQGKKGFYKRKECSRAPCTYGTACRYLHNGDLFHDGKTWHIYWNPRVQIYDERDYLREHPIDYSIEESSFGYVEESVGRPQSQKENRRGSASPSASSMSEERDEENDRVLVPSPNMSSFGAFRRSVLSSPVQSDRVPSPLLFNSELKGKVRKPVAQHAGVALVSMRQEDIEQRGLGSEGDEILQKIGGLKALFPGVEISEG